MFVIFVSPIIEVNLEDTCTRCVNIQVNLAFHPLITIFEVTSKILCTRCEKYSNKFDVSRSFIRIFAA